MTTTLPPRQPEVDDITDRGLQFDLQTWRAQMNRRGALRLFGGVAALALVGTSCSDADPAPAGSPAGTPRGGTATPSSPSTAGGSAVATVSPIPTQATPASACTGAIPRETAGPYPGDGSNGPNVLTQSGIVRRDIRSSIGISSTEAAGIPLVVRLTVVDTTKGCSPVQGAAVYLWHCDQEGRYSMYTLPNENYLRGVQEADADGVVVFETIFPGCYDGRWPHIHFEVYPSLERATSSANKVATSQLAFPEDVCRAVYATAGYGQSQVNLGRVTLQTDNVFRDGWQQQLAEMSGDVARGYTASLIVGL